MRGVCVWKAQGQCNRRAAAVDARCPLPAARPTLPTCPLPAQPCRYSPRPVAHSLIDVLEESLPLSDVVTRVVTRLRMGRGGS